MYSFGYWRNLSKHFFIQAIFSNPVPYSRALLVEVLPKKRQFKFDVKDRLKLEDEP